jgi:predicted enzyme related to lactoylglutathione lyase
MPALHHHAINYLEIPVKDMAGAQDFYRTAFDWRFTDYGPEYAGILDPIGEGEVGGLRLEQEVQQGGAA